MKLGIKAYHYHIILILLLVSVPPFLVASVYNMDLFLQQSTSLINAKNETELVRTGAFMEKTLEQIRKDVLTGAANDQYTRTQLTNDKTNIIKSLTQLVFNKEYLDQASVYNEDEGYLLISNYGILSDLRNTPYERIVEELGSMTNYEVKGSGTWSLEREGKARSVVSLYAKLPLREAQTFLIFNIDIEKLYNEFLRQLNVDDEIYSYYMTDADGIVIYHKDKTKIGKPAETGMQPADRYSVNSYPLKGMGWQLVGEVNVYELYHDVYKARNKMIVLLVVVALAISGLIGLGARQLYKPVGAVMAKVAAAFTGKLSRQGEFDFLSSAFDDVLQTNSHLKHRLNESEQLLKRTLLHNLLKDRFAGSPDIGRYLSGYGAHLAVVLFTLRGRGESPNGANPVEQLERELDTRFEHDLFTESNREAVALFRLRDGDLNAFITELIAGLDEEVLKRLTVSIGGVYPLDKINNSYVEALYACNMGRLYSPQTNIYCYNKLPVDYSHSQIKDPAIEELELAVRQRNEKTYTEMLHTMFSEKRSLMEYNFNLYMNISLLIRLYDQESVVFLNEINELITDNGIMNADCVKQFFLGKFQSFNADYRTDFKDYVQKVEKYVEEHFAENFSMDDVAANAGVTRQYISQLFKKQYNMTLIDYVSQFRIERAKKLLADTAIKVTDIGSSTGFNSKSYFTKVFKQYTGITPTEYRELAWNRNKETENESLIPLKADG